jgi:3-oxoacyl-[acyl-carrier-protein] synthase II
LSSAGRAVVITGCGVVSPLGAGVPAFWEGLVAGRSAVAPILGFAAEDLAPRNAAEVGDARFSGLADRAGEFALGAAREALSDARLTEILPPQTGVVLGTTLGGMQLFERWIAGERVRELSQVPYYAPGARLARALGCRGPVATTQLACASGTHAVALASDWVRSGQADIVLAGGTDLLCRFVVAGFNALRATAEIARPFDQERKGLVLGERPGAAPRRRPMCSRPELRAMRST